MIKHIVISMVVALGLLHGAAADAEVVDVTRVSPPKGWNRVEHPGGLIEYNTTNEKAGAVASVSITPSMPAVGDGRANFDAAWAQIIASMLSNAPAPTMAPAATRNGWQIVRGSAKYTYEQRAARTTIFTATRDGKYVIVIATTIGSSFVKDVDKVLASLTFTGSSARSTTTPAPTTPAPTTPAATGDVAGAWGFSTGGSMGTGRYAAWLSDRREYTFDGKGNYSFLRRHNVDHDPDTSIIRERGTYTLAGDVLTLTPAKSEREIWSKVKSGANAGAYDKLLRRENVAKEKAEYRVSFTLYPDTQVQNLMLTSREATQRDGNFNASTQYRLFRPDGNYYTAIPPTP